MERDDSGLRSGGEIAEKFAAGVRKVEVCMKKQILAVCAALLLTPLISLAQAMPEVTAKVPFKFVVEGKTLPAGRYEFKLMENDLSAVMITDMKTEHSIMVPIIAPAGLQSANHAKIVFDKTGKTSYLSEVVIPGMDGYFIAAPTGRHQQKSVRGVS